MSTVPRPDVDTVLIWNARGSVAETIKYLSNTDRAMIHPIADWLVTLREMLVEMRQYDGTDHG